MINLKEKLLGGWLGERVLTEGRVLHVASVGPSYRTISLEAHARGTAVSFAAGDKVQVFLPGVGTRTYTPFASRGTRTFDLLVYLHGTAPGTAWARELAPGDRVRFVGPQTSLPLATFVKPAALFGDETSLAVAGSLLQTHGPTARVLIEASDAPAARDAGAQLGIPADAIVERMSDDALRAAIINRLATEGGNGGDGGTLVLTGSAQRIQQVRAVLRVQGTKTKQKVKAYWSLGKRGLD